MLHYLKTDKPVFDMSWAGCKDWEMRKNDRNYQVGDVLILQETEFTGEEMAPKHDGGYPGTTLPGKPLVYTGREIVQVVTFILSGPVYGLKDGWVVMSTPTVGKSEQPQDWSHLDGALWRGGRIDMRQAEGTGLMATVERFMGAKAQPHPCDGCQQEGEGCRGCGNHQFIGVDPAAPGTDKSVEWRAKSWEKLPVRNNLRFEPRIGNEAPEEAFTRQYLQQPVVAECTCGSIWETVTGGCPVHGLRRQ